MSWNPFYQDYAVQFTKHVDILESVNIQKLFVSQAAVMGNAGNANADAKAVGYDSLAESLTLTYAIQGVGSGAFSESTSATNGAHWYIA